jgi:hypothetical protein
VVVEGDVVDWYEVWVAYVEIALTPAGKPRAYGERLLGLKEESDYEGRPAGELFGGKGERDH